MTAEIHLGFVPLLDAAPLILAERMGFAAEERLHLRLHPTRSWSLLRDMLASGHIAAAQMLSAVPIAGRLGLGGAAVSFDVPMVLSLGGQVIGVSADLAQAMRDEGFYSDFRDAIAARTALRRARPAGLRVGVPFPFSMQAELLHLWLGDRSGMTAITVPPARMADALISGEIEAFCVGEPWGAVAVDCAAAELILPGTAIWSAAPEKVLALRQGWAEAHPDLAGRLLRAIWRACRWLAQPDSRAAASDLLAHALNVDPEMIERALSGHLLLSRSGATVNSPDFVNFHAGAANFPWRSQAAWLGWHLGRRHGLDGASAAGTAADCWRPDLFRQHLGTDAVLPAASAKVEGANPAPVTAGANRGTLTLGRNTFFDGRIFDLSAPA
ncbi:CmpA/NrtA family ABC transporter substrate-binding protein [Paracoccus xiamenensis]|uniref:CmpA/NrtA family ABC transporter substrate-binding protein n=1 Tax=Paracoccus xiamenensis TaxID=2714901 RepID=UPI00140D39F8|nr:CmpA/NrtA family ABC transporter substrate-binding protein [Paracoccus xiamenensis]NHF72691.1 ABC transporter substrate-binding protein [Paracoccus xiamenensis]